MVRTLLESGRVDNRSAIDLLQQIYETGEVKDEAGQPHELHSHIDREEGQLVHSLLKQHKFTTTLEIGCAFGISSLYICDALSHQESPRHTIIDPHQTAQWHGIGVANLKRAGLHFFELIEKPSEIALPTLLAQGRSFHFAFIDGWHTFDHTLLDFFYVDRLLEEGGVVVVDDVNFPSVRKVIRYISNYPNYRLVAACRTRPSAKRRLVHACISLLAKTLPNAVDEVISDSWRCPASLPGFRCSMVALQKTGPNTRNWNWYKPF